MSAKDRQIARVMMGLAALGTLVTAIIKHEEVRAAIEPFNDPKASERIDWSTEGPGNGCPAEVNLDAYGDAAIYDGRIEIEGSPEFVGRTVIALNRLYDTEVYAYVKALHRIVERNDGAPDPYALAWIYPGTATAYVRSGSALRSCTAYASTIVHEGAHELGYGEAGARAIQASALKELGELGLAAQVSIQAARYGR